MKITQRYLRRYPDSKRTKSWAGRLVHIQTENGVWRTDGHGYTYAGKPDAWILPFEDAKMYVDHCGPENQAAFIEVIAHRPDLIAFRQSQYDAHGATSQCDQEPVAMIVSFEADKKEPRIVSWNALPVGEHRLFTHPTDIREQTIRECAEVIDELQLNSLGMVYEQETIDDCKLAVLSLLKESS